MNTTHPSYKAIKKTPDKQHHRSDEKNEKYKFIDLWHKY